MFVRTIPCLAMVLAGCAASARPCTGEPCTGATSWQKGNAKLAQACEDWDEWDKPAEPFLIHGNTWYVGTCGISAI